MNKIIISKEIREKCGHVQLGCIHAQLEVMPQSDALWRAIDEERMAIHNILQIEKISQMPAIEASRKAYKKLGKDPARYRLSAEALLRRIVKGEKLYQVNNVVDLVNLASFSSGFSIGGYDTSKLNGDVQLSIGKSREPYKAIGRGTMNIENLPVLRDNSGAFGSPTSDSERTSVTGNTKHFLMVFFDFGTPDLLQESMNYAESLLVKFAGAQDIKTQIIQ